MEEREIVVFATRESLKGAAVLFGDVDPPDGVWCKSGAPASLGDARLDRTPRG